MTPTDTTIDYKVCSFLHLHSNFGYNSLGSTCTCHYLNVGTNIFQSASPSKLNFRFIGNPIVLHCEGHNSSIQSAIEVNEYLMESLFDKLSNGSSPTSISHWQGLQIIETFCHYFCRVLQRRRGLVIPTWDITPTDMTIDYKVCSFLYFHSNFGYNSLGSTCTCHYWNVGTNVSQSASPSKLNFWFVDSPIVLHWEGYNSSI
jgi:hypothetical protein